MENKQKGVLLLLLDLIGAVLFAVGAMGAFGAGSLLPEAWQFPGHNLLLITLGIALIVPYMLHVLRNAPRSH